MAREEKVWEYAIEAGYTPLEDRCIIVKGAAGNLSDKIVRFFSACDVAVLQMCENELILLPFDLLGNPRKRCIPCRSLFGDRIGEACQRPAQRDHRHRDEHWQRSPYHTAKGTERYPPLGHLRITVCWRVQELACRKRRGNLKGS
mgnify:CR=1 FL=1